MYRLCCVKLTRDPRIIRGRGTGSNITSSSTKKKALNKSSRKTNHRHGTSVPQTIGFTASD